MININLDSPSPPEFLNLSFPEHDRGEHYFAMEFQLDRQGLVVYSVAKVTTNVNALLSGEEGLSLKEIGNGRIPVFNSSQSHAINITACPPNIFSPGEEYVVVAVARDKYGRVQGEATKKLVKTLPNN